MKTYRKMSYLLSIRCRLNELELELVFAFVIHDDWLCSRLALQNRNPRIELLELLLLPLLLKTLLLFLLRKSSGLLRDLRPLLLHLNAEAIDPVRTRLHNEIDHTNVVGMHAFAADDTALSRKRLVANI